MKRLIVLFALLSAGAYAAPGMLETQEEARQRQNAERYEAYKERGYQAPLGGYQDKLGDPAPYGTERPGYTPQGQQYEGWKDRLKH